MAKIKKTIALKNVYIDSANPLELQEYDKENCRFYSLEKIALEFADQEGVSITFSCDDEVPSEPDGVMDDNVMEEEAE